MVYAHNPSPSAQQPFRNSTISASGMGVLNGPACGRATPRNESYDALRGMLFRLSDDILFARPLDRPGFTHICRRFNQNKSAGLVATPLSALKLYVALSNPMSGSLPDPSLSDASERSPTSSSRASPAHSSSSSPSTARPRLLRLRFPRLRSPSASPSPPPPPPPTRSARHAVVDATASGSSSLLPPRSRAPKHPNTIASTSSRRVVARSPGG